MNREELLAFKPKRVKSVDIPGIGAVCLRVLTAREALALEVGLRQDRSTPEGMEGMVAVQLAAFICDESGVPLLSLDDAKQLVGQWSANQIRVCIQHGADLNGLGETAVEEAGKN
jgi:hypothetical protein